MGADEGERRGSGFGGDVRGAILGFGDVAETMLSSMPMDIYVRKYGAHLIHLKIHRDSNEALG